MIYPLMLARINAHWYARWVFNAFLMCACAVGFLVLAVKRISVLIVLLFVLFFCGCQSVAPVPMVKEETREAREIVSPAKNDLVQGLLTTMIKDGCPMAQECRRQLDIVCKTEIMVLTGITIPIVLATLSYAWKNWKTAKG